MSGLLTVVKRVPPLSLWLLLGGVTLSACASNAATPRGTMEAASTAVSAPPVAATPRPTEPRASYHFLRGHLAELSQDFDGAVQQYQAAIGIDGTSDFLKTRLAVLYFTMGDTTHALSYAEQVRPAGVRDAQTLSQLAGIYAGSGQRDKALEIYDRAIAVDAERAEAHFSKGLLLTNLKRYEQAEAAFQEGLKVAPNSPLAHYYLGRLALERREPAQAITSFERAIEANPTFEQAYLSLGAVHEASHSPERAVTLYRRYLDQVNPQSREVRQQLIRLYLQGRSYPDALRELEATTAHDPTDLDAQLRMSLILGEMKEYPKALAKLEAILKERPDELRVRDYQALMFEENKQFDRAKQAYEDNLAREANYYDSRLHYGFLLYRQKQWAEAAEQLKAALRLNPKQADGHLLLGLTYLQSEQPDLAAKVFEEAVTHHPTNADLFFNLGTAYDKLNRFDDVVRAMERSLQLDPKHADALNYLGYTYADRGVKVEEAVTLTQRAVALKPENGYYVDSLAWAFFKQGRLADALTEMKRAVSLVGEDPVLFEHLGDIYLKQNQKSEAREAWLHSLELDPKNGKLLERFRASGLTDEIAEERIRQAQQKPPSASTAIPPASGPSSSQ